MTALRRGAVVVLISMLGLQACVTGAALDAERQRGRDAERAQREKNWPQAQLAYKSYIDGRGFHELPQDEQFRALRNGAFVGLHHGDKALGYDYLLRSAAMPQAGARDWVELTASANARHNDADTVRGLIELAKRWPADAQELDYRLVASALRAIRAQPREAQLNSWWALYESHFKMKWDEEPSLSWRDLTLLLVEKDRLADAGYVASHITSAYVLMLMRSDRRFDAVVLSHPDHFDVEAAAHEQLRVAQALSDNNPKVLALRLYAVSSLRQLRDYGAMLAAADELKAEIASTNFPRRLFADYDDEYREVLNMRATALERMGRPDDAVQELRTASRLSEQGARNVSQSINLGALLCRLNRPREALAAIADVGPMSEFGRSMLEIVRLQAALQLKDDAQTAESLQGLESLRAAQPASYERGLVFAGQLDLAAQSLIARLQDPVERQDALGLVQDFPPMPVAKIEQYDNETWRGLIGRPDVQAAIDKVGRAKSYRLELLD